MKRHNHNTDTLSAAELARIVARANIRPEEIVAARRTWRAILKALRLIHMKSHNEEPLDGQGYSIFHAALGATLARMRRLTPALMALGRRLVHRYRRQVPLKVLSDALGNKSLAEIKLAIWPMTGRRRASQRTRR